MGGDGHVHGHGSALSPLLGVVVSPASPAEKGLPLWHRISPSHPFGGRTSVSFSSVAGGGRGRGGVPGWPGPSPGRLGRGLRYFQHEVSTWAVAKIFWAGTKWRHLAEIGLVVVRRKFCCRAITTPPCPRGRKPATYLTRTE